MAFFPWSPLGSLLISRLKLMCPFLPPPVLTQNIDFSKATKTRGLYQKWVKATHQRVAASGAHEEPAADKGLANRWGGGEGGRVVVCVLMPLAMQLL